MSLKTNRRKRTVVVVLITTMNALFLVLMLTDFDKNSNALVQTTRSLHSAEVAIGADLLSLFPELTNVSLNDLEPVLLTPRRKMRKKLVVGIPVVERKRNYILETLTSLLGELDEFHRKDVLFLVMFGCRQSSSDFVTNTTASIRRKFAKDVDDGLLQIAAIPTVYYKINIDDVPSTFDDSSQRMQWRTKQSIDYIYLMTYARTLGDHYMQLEDDVVAAASYARVIFNYLAFKGDKKWFYIEFSKIGFIGKLFRARELRDVVKAIALYYRYKPVDWILFDIIHCRYCRPDKGATDCTKVIKTAIIYSGAPQFQHVGTVSSLQGKQQTIRDVNFGKGKAQGTRDNPLAQVNSTMKYRSGYEPERGYANNNAIWFQNVVKGGRMIVTFSPPITITELTSYTIFSTAECPAHLAVSTFSYTY